MNEEPKIVISKLEGEEITEASWMLANSMCTNPNHIAIFKSTKASVIKKQQRLFEMVLSNPNNITFKAKVNGQMVGTFTYTTSENCQMRTLKIIRQIPKLFGMFGSHLFRILRWRKNWSKHDYKYRHIHFGPIAVHKDHQGKGIGKEMLKFFCIYLDEANEVGYLETDKAQNVPLYEQFGFRVIETDILWGNMNWFMLRDLRTTPS